MRLCKIRHLLGAVMTRKYRSHTVDLKLKVAIEASRNEKTINQIASEYDVSPTLVVDWKKHLLCQGKEIFQNKRVSKKSEAHEDVALLQQQVGKLTVQVDWLKKKLGSSA